jgi:hypothetical protein
MNISYMYVCTHTYNSVIISYSTPIPWDDGGSRKETLRVCLFLYLKKNNFFYFKLIFFYVFRLF